MTTDAVLYRSSTELTREGRTLVGLAMPWDKPARVSDNGGRTFYLEEFTSRSMDDTLRAAPADGFPVFVGHRRAEDPIGVVEYETSSEGLLYQAPISRTKRGDEYLTLVDDGAMRSVSVGVMPRLHVKRSTAAGLVISRTRVDMRELSLAPTGFGQYPDARVDAIRSSDGTFSEITDAVSDAIGFAVFGDKGPPMGAWVYVREITTDWVVYNVEGGGELDEATIGAFKATYEVDDAGKVTLSPAVPVKVAYVARSSAVSRRGRLADLERRARIAAAGIVLP